MVLFTKDNTDTDKPVPVVNLPPVRFICGPPKQERTGNIQGAWDPNILISGMNFSSPIFPLRSHFLVCDKNNLFIVGLGPIRDKEL